MGDIANQIYAARWEAMKEEGFESPGLVLVTQDIYDKLEEESQNFLLYHNTKTPGNFPASIFGMRIKVIHLNKGDG